ncbi:MAG: DNA-directed RNA polymerase subunit omega [Candidatus Omnitrophota bacterium]
MPYQPIERLLSKTDGSVYKLVILASQRALELAEGMPTLIEERTSDKPTVLSLDEIAEEKVGMQISQAKEKPKAKQEEKPKQKEQPKQEKPKEKSKEKKAEKAKKKSK